MGSVKDIVVLKEATEKEPGIGAFVFSDNYSVFDWGKMPDEIPDKGASLCLQAAYFFEQAEKRGLKTHYLGLIVKGGKRVRLDELTEPTNTMEIYLVRTIKPIFKDGKYDYSAFTPTLTNFLIPLEIIYRNIISEGSSLLERLNAGTLSLEELGLEDRPKLGEKLKKPILEISTKFEAMDRYISIEEAKELVCLDEREIEEIKRYVNKANALITEIAEKAGLLNEDGKLELAYNTNRELMIVDVAGTLDECRFSYKGIPVSKEILRKFYKKTKWYKDVEKAKEKARERKIEDWKSLCESLPEPLAPKLKDLVSKMYKAATNALIGKKLFEVPELEKIMNQLENY